MGFLETRTISQSISEPAGFGLLGMVLVIFMTTTAVFITAMMVPMMSNKQSKETYTKGNALHAALTAYKANIGVYPTVVQGGVAALLIQPAAPVTSCAMSNNATSSTLQGWCGPYLDQVIVENTNGYQTDGWGTLFQYVPATGVVSSCGPNRVCGDGDDISF